MSYFESMLEEYIYCQFDSEFEINIYKHHASGHSPWSEEEDRNHDLFCKRLGCSFKEGLRYKRLQKNWSDLHRKFIMRCIEPNNTKDFYDSIDDISDFLFLWSNELVVDDVLNRLSKYVIAKQIIGNNIFSLNRAELKKTRETPSANAPTKPLDFYINTLMLYLESGNISEVARKCNISNSTVRLHLNKVIGDNYSEGIKGTHPENDLILDAYEIWKSKEKS